MVRYPQGTGVPLLLRIALLCFCSYLLFCFNPKEVFKGDARKYSEY